MTDKFNINFCNGIDMSEGAVLLIDKPYTWTSFNVVNKIRVMLRRHTGNKNIKVGHAGTLDPLATGLLVVCVGKATKKANELTNQQKVYEATFKLGETTASFDLEKPVNARYATEHITKSLVQSVVGQFVGKQEQVPPVFSAKLIDGKRAYKMARQGQDVEMKPVEIEIFNMQILEFAMPFLRLRIDCSKGTYIRSIARDLGYALNSGAHLTQLRRLASGNFNINNAITIEELENMLQRN